MDKSNYDEVREIYSYDKNDKILLGYAVWKNFDGDFRMALLDKNGKQLTDFIYRDCAYEAEGNYLVVGDSIIYEDPKGKCNVFDFRRKCMLFQHSYTTLEIIDSENDLFYISNISDMDKNYDGDDKGQLINLKEEKISQRIFRMEPSIFGLWRRTKEDGQGFDILPDKMYYGLLSDCRQVYFTFEGTQFLPWRIFNTIFVPKEHLYEVSGMLADRHFYCLATECSMEQTEDMRCFEWVKYNFVREYDLNHPITEAERKQYGDKLHILHGYVYNACSCYDNRSDTEAKIRGHSMISAMNPSQKIASADENGIPLIGQIVTLFNTTIDEGVAYARGCYGMDMTLISIDDCASDKSTISDLEFFDNDLTSIFNYLEYYLCPDTAGIEEKIAERTESLYRQAFPFLTSIDYYGHTILPCFEVAQEFFKIAKDAKRTYNKEIEKTARKAYEFLASACEKFDYPHCLFVRFDGE